MRCHTVPSVARPALKFPNHTTYGDTFTAKTTSDQESALVVTCTPTQLPTEAPFYSETEYRDNYETKALPEVRLLFSILQEVYQEIKG